ncbi:MAG: hypothetical protein B7C24_04210 [Bacteroidetes bacterium 4572_77]|nr:MAG: hypothetical protein B7C24_04210 [Bacteroidetes bacterium 4572_77]
MLDILKIGIVIGIIFSFNACTKKLEPIQDTPKPTDTTLTMGDLIVPQDFNFETAKDVEVSFNGFKSTRGEEVKFSIYLYTEETTPEEITYEDEGGNTITETIEINDVHNNLVASLVSSDNNFSINLTIPQYYEFLYVVRNDMGVYTSQILPIENNKASFNGFKSINEDPVDVIYGVNGGGDVFTINPETGDFVIIDQYPSGQAGSYTCALDPISRVLYTIDKSTKDLLAYDIDNGTWEIRGYTGVGGPRLEYRKEDGLLYFSTGKKLKTINPANGETISTYTINGLHYTGWGDVAFDENGVLFLVTKSGLYRCDVGANNTYDATRISAENPPFNFTSMTFDSNGELWLGSNSGGSGQVIIMDQVTGGWEMRYEDFPAQINDLTFLPLDENQIQEVDSDNDGIIDFYDEYPNDGERAYDTYTPSIYGWGTYAFEDLWPYEGDYDFNDLVLNYRFTHVCNQDDLIVETYMAFNIKNIGGSFRNGFGIEIDMDENLIQSVTGSDLTAGIVTLNANGLEANQDKAVVILFDDAWATLSNTDSVNLVVSYNTPISMDDFGSLNPFIFINGDRGREVHLSNQAPTSLMNNDLFGTGDDDSNPANGRYYKTANHLPWGISIIHDFVFLTEKSAVILGYNRFDDWAESGGVDYVDWYKDQDGNRNNAYLEY